MDEVEAVKTKVRLYRTYCRDIAKINERLADIWHDLSGIRGISYDNVPSPSNFEEWRKIERFEEKEPELIELNFKLKIAKGCKLETESLLKKLPKETRTAVIRIYADGERTDVVAMDYNISASGLHGRINRAIRKYITNAHAYAQISK